MAWSLRMAARGVWINEDVFWDFIICRSFDYTRLNIDSVCGCTFVASLFYMHLEIPLIGDVSPS